jgi:DNA-binding response OmpR family regulator
MMRRSDLKGRYVLVVEDEILTATAAAAVLEDAGAKILGPCPNEADAFIVLRNKRPDAVVLNINHSDGDSFKLAESLRASGVPFMFLTGYRSSMIPKAFAEVERLEKPVEVGSIVDAVARLIAKEADTPD